MQDVLDMFGILENNWYPGTDAVFHSTRVQTAIPIEKDELAHEMFLLEIFCVEQGCPVAADRVHFMCNNSKIINVTIADLRRELGYDNDDDEDTDE